jgi:hypothetical protein
MPKHYAFAMPGKIGDLLYILPLIHKVCERDDAVADVFTSEICRPVERLFRYQKHINDFIIPKSYVIRDLGQGVQPWHMEVEGDYDAIYQLGYQHFPSGPLHQYAALVAGEAPVEDPKYDFPDIKYFDEPYIVVGHCSNRSSSEMAANYRYFVDRSPIKTVQTGVPEDWVGGPSENMTGLDLLETLSLISRAKAFIGFYSGLLVLANGFPGLLKVVTMWPGVGEQHGLHIPVTIDLYPATGPSILKTITDNL